MSPSRCLVALISLVAFTSGVFPGSLRAATFGDFTYKVVGSSVTITKYWNSSYDKRAVTIPSEIDGRPVRSIGANAFAHRKEVTAVTIPDSVVNIGKRAFGTCGLTSVTIPDSVLHIQPGAFRKCYWMKNVTLGSGVKSIGAGAFEDCNTLASIAVAGSNPKYSSEGGVLYNKLKTKIVEFPTGFVGAFTCPDTLTAIKPGAFEHRFRMTRVEIGDGITSIGAKAFSDCSRLAEVAIGSGVTLIGAGAFSNCNSLDGIIVDGSNPNFCSQDGVLFNKAKTEIVNFPHHFAGEYTIPDSVTSMPDDSFTWCNRLTGLKIGNGITSIPRLWFKYCWSLTSITFGTGVATIRGETSDDDPFDYCSRLDKVIFLGNAPQMEPGVFQSPYLPANFTVYFSPGGSGFTVPEWHGKPAVAGVPETAIKTPDSVLSDGGSTDSFGQVAVGSPVVHTFTIRNTGTAPLEDLSIAKHGADSGDFTVTDPLETTLAPDASTTFEVTFEPSATGIRKAAIHVSSHDLVHNPFDILLEGEGIPAAPVAPAAASAPALRSASAFAACADWKLAVSGSLAVSSHGGDARTGVEVSGGRKYLTLTVFKAPATWNQKRVVEVSPDFFNWFSGKNYTTVLRDDAKLLEVRDNTPLAPGSKRYIRVK